MTGLEFSCRACGSPRGRAVLDLGIQPLANNLLPATDGFVDEPKFPLRLAVCEQCWLVQITDLVPPVRLFSEYLYLSSFSDTMLRHARAAAARYIREFGSAATSSFVVEVASNDGYLLKNFVAAGFPASASSQPRTSPTVARQNGVETEQAFFGHDLARKTGHGPAGRPT